MQQIGTKEVQEKVQLVGEGDSLEIVQDFLIVLYTMTRKNDEWWTIIKEEGIDMTLLYKNITLSTLFLKRVSWL